MKVSKNQIIPWLVLIAFAIANGICAANADKLGPWAAQQCPRIAGFCHEAPLLVGTLAIALLWTAYGMLGGDANPLELIRGTDKRFSTSKCQFFMWTVMATFSYASTIAALIGVHLLTQITTKAVGGSVIVPTNLLLAMGFSVTTALAAKGIVVNQLNNGTAAKDHIDPANAAYGDLVKDDGGAIDLTKVQMMGWTLIGLGAYFAGVVNLVNQIGTGQVHDKITLPDIDTALMVLMGLGQGAYLAKKAITTTTPTIASVKNSSALGSRPNTEVTINGSSYGAAKADSVITFNGVNANFPIKNWSDTAITFVLTDALLNLVPSQANIGVIVSGQQSNTVPFNVLRLPVISAVAVAGANLNVSGTGFGNRKDGDRILINGVLGNNVSVWNDTAIALQNPSPANVSAGKQVPIVLNVDGDSITFSINIT